MPENASPLRPIRSFVRRRGRMTLAQKKALENLWPVYGIDPTAPFNAQTVFGRTASLTVEIGFGNGDNLAANAQQNSQNDYLGIEVHEPGIGHLMDILAKQGIENVRIYRGDALEILRENFDDGMIDRINLYFPDPWPKKRHHKRRLVSPDFAELVFRKLKRGGIFHAATDWEDYAQQMKQILDDCAGLEDIEESNSALQVVAERSTTRFEQRGVALGHRVQDIIYKKN